MKFLIACLLVVLYCSVCVNGDDARSNLPVPASRDLLKHSRSIATHLLANNSNGTTPTEIANHMIQSITGVKYSLLTSLANFLAPVIQSILIFAVILFGLAGTGSIVCSLFDCQSGLGLNGILYGNSYNPVMSNMPFSPQHNFMNMNSMNTDPSNLMRVMFKRKDEFPRKSWTMMPSLSPPIMDGQF